MVRFISTFSKVVAIFLLLFVGIFWFAYYQIPNDGSFSEFLNLPLTAFAVPYLVFIASWAIAYSKHFSFPERQYILVFGVAIGALGIAAMIVFGETDIATGVPDWREILKVFAGALAFGLFGAAMQLYFLVIVIRYFPIKISW